MAENYGVLFVLHRASQYLSSTKAMADNEKENFRSELYRYLNGQSITTVDKRVLAFLTANDFLTPEDHIKLRDEELIKSQSNNACSETKEGESEPEA